jgi:hypothetical protein
MPPLTTCGFEGEPFVSTWQVGGGVLLLAQTFVDVKPVVAGKLKD